MSLRLLSCLLAFVPEVWADPGDIDATFQPVVDGEIHAMAVQSDQRVLIGGTFTNVDSNPHRYLARLHPDGRLDESFNASSVATGPVESVFVQPDGRVLFGFGGRLARVDSTGRRQATNSIIPWHDALFVIDDPGSQFSGRINTLVLDSAGRVVVGGQFNRYESTNGTRTARSYVARLLSDGRLDPGFVADVDSAVAPEFAVRSVLYQPDGKIIVAGWINSVTFGGGKQLGGIFRLNSDGRLDQTFVNTNAFTNAWRIALSGATLQPDGKIVAMGLFQHSAIQYFLMRLNADRSLDPTFKAGYSNTDAYANQALGLQKHGKMLAFHHWGVQRFARYLPNGNPDPDFQFDAPTSYYRISALAIQSDSKILLAGRRGDVNPRPFLIRVIGSADARFQSIARQGNNTRLLLRGESYQPYQLQYSADLANWTATTTLASTNGLAEFEHQGSAPRLFYRATQGP